MNDSVSYRPVIIGISCFLVGFIVYMIGSYMLETRRLIDNINSSLETQARSISIVLGQEVLDKLLAEEVEDEEYDAYVRSLSDFCAQQGLTYLYVLKRSGAGMVNVITSATEEEWDEGDFQRNGEEYEDTVPHMEKALNSLSVQSDSASDSFGSFRSTYVPGRSKDGSLYLLGADMATDDVAVLQRRNLLRSIFTGVCFLLFVTPLLILTARDLQAKRNILAEEVQRQTERINLLNEDLQAKLADVEVQAEVSRKALEEAEQARAARIAARAEGTKAAAAKLEEVLLTLNDALQELDARVHESQQGANAQAAQVMDTVQAVNLMNDSIIDVARNAGAASDLTASARSEARQGAETAQQAVDGMLKVIKETEALRENMATLGEYTKSITQIMSMISEVADQTNLLALNAAIEAARAGEAGRGFAVVADEVRKLAEKTMSSTTEVSKVVEHIAHSSQKSMDQMDVAAQVIQSAMSLVEESGTALGRVQERIDSAADQVGAIAQTAQQQSESSGEINASISSINSIAEQTASHMSKAEQALAQLSVQTHNLGDMVEDMKKG